MKTKWRWLALFLCVFALAAAGCGGDDDNNASGDTTAAETDGEAAGGTLVFAGASDPISLGPALASDGESIRPASQIFETLVNLKPGGTDLVPGLAESWEVAPDAKAITFKLREGVRFTDGEPFNAEAVCSNFNRWYNFTGAAQSASASYYWQVTFGGYAKISKENEALGQSLFASCEANDETSVTLNFTRPSASVLGALTLAPFSIASPKALVEFKADAGTVDDTGFHPTGTFGTEHPTGTGPFKLESWQRGERVTLVRNDDYWGEKAKLDKLIIQPIGDNAARLQALQTGEVQGYDLVEPQDVPTIEDDSTLQLLDRPAFNIFYVTINQKLKPFDKLEVRQAVAYGLDRQAVVDKLLRRPWRGGEGVPAADPVGLRRGRHGVHVRPREGEGAPPEGGRDAAAEGGLLVSDGCLAAVHARPEAELRGLRGQPEQVRLQGRPAQRSVEPGLPRPRPEGKGGALNFLGQTGDYADADNFIGIFFQGEKPQWGFKNPELTKALDEAEVEPDVEARKATYEEINRMIMEYLPGIPVAHSKSALAFTANVKGYVPSPTTNESFANVTIK